MAGNKFLDFASFYSYQFCMCFHIYCNVLLIRLGCHDAIYSFFGSLYDPAAVYAFFSEADALGGNHGHYVRG